MKIINAVWEKKNLGLETVEVIVENDDIKEDILPLICKIDAEYVVVKVPSNYESISYDLFKDGFFFIETMNCLRNDLHLQPLSERKLEIVQNTDFVKMSDADFFYMCQKILAENIYQTDRIARDPHFTVEQSNQRYVNWLKDERTRGSEIYKYIYNGEDIGFLCFRDIGNGVFEDFLSGIYSQFSGKGLAVCIPYKLDSYVKECGGKSIITHISSTNVRSLSSRINNGYVIDSSNYIFVKHQS